MPLQHSSTLQARVSLVEQHIARENAHDLDGIVGTDAQEARYDDEPWDAPYVGIREVRASYTQLRRAMPDLRIDVTEQHVADAAIVVEVIIRGHHQGAWH